MQQGVPVIRALIIDDIESVRQHLRQILFQLGIVDVLEAKDGLSAGALFNQYKPELVFLDLQLPDINGQLLLKQFKLSQQQTKVFIISAYSTVDNLKQALEYGASAFVIKPISAHRISKLVQPLLV
ncbi:response regulator transcription factor [Rheinheimera salexigens]|uniref:Two-component system response regulator n=1 Tax=Rheinheimera salexigens TaxID=1628148 RepID=A0A1E7Q9E1_9GAMM|nr:response regulator [Rheinheimera salexigens]OEY70721.1 two-component system response regulator [Rheinheimera salexigens]